MAAPSPLHFSSFHYAAPEPGTRAIILGATHGNETCGTEAIRGVIADIEAGRLALLRGAVSFVPVVNPLAYAQGTRAGERNLNRDLAPKPAPRDFEDRIANWLCPLLAAHDALLDLHSFNAAGGEPFALVGPGDNTGTLEPFQRMAEERDWARRLGVRRFVTGWMAAYGAGVRLRTRAADPALETLLRYGVGTTEYMRSVGGYAVTLECGQHRDPNAPLVARSAILNTLAHLGIVDAPPAPPLAPDAMEALRLACVVDRLDPRDRFARPWTSFDPVRQGEPIGQRADGTPVLAEFTGRIVFPDENAAPNQEWFYLARPDPDFARAPAPG